MLPNHIYYQSWERVGPDKATDITQQMGSKEDHSEIDVASLRRRAGRWLKELREAKGLSQRALAAKIAVDYYTLISQLESGHGRIPPDRYHVWAEALGVEPRNFVCELMRYYEPVTYKILFGKAGAHNRVAKLAISFKGPELVTSP